jgi:NAD(P)-dependent dehydrogenase (short-subunit alcohol dehydrogenase family)
MTTTTMIKNTTIVAALLLLAFVQPLEAWSNVGSSSSTAKGGPLGKKSTALDVLKHLKQSNQLGFPEGGVAVVTGGNAGIGAVSCNTLALAGMQVVLCARNVEAARQVVDLWPSNISDRVEIQELDLANLESVKKAAKEILGRHPNISVLLNNAGVMAPPTKLKTTQLIELQFGTNHVGHHMWTRLLLPHMNDKGRIVTVASEAHRFPSGNIEWQPEDYSAWREYGQSKLANILFAKRLQELLTKQGKMGMQSVCLHPGVIGTSLWRYLPKIVQPFTRLFADKTVEQGAAANVYCSLAERIQGGAYYNDCQVSQPTSTAKEVQLRKDLWEYTEALIAEKGFEMPQELFRDGKVTALSGR